MSDKNDIEEIEIETQPVKQKKQLSEQQLLNLKKARERATERKKELAQLSGKSKALKEEKLKLDAIEYDNLKKEEEIKKIKQKELDEIVNKPQKQTTVKPDVKKKKVKKIIYEDSSDDDDVETIVVRRKKEPREVEAPPIQQKQSTFNELAKMSIGKQLHDKLHQEKVNSLCSQLVNVRY